VATPLKELYGRDLPERLADAFAPVVPGFDSKKFLREAREGFDELAFMDRGKRLADILAKHLPASFPEAAKLLSASLGPEDASDSDTSHGMSPFFYHTHTVFVERAGIDHPDIALDLLHELTRRFTGEWAIRPFLVKHPALTLARLRVWISDPSPHVRRLVSEGSRPRLPWGMRLREFVRDPAPGLALLELLRDDPEIYVRRSVANHLNDIGKDHPELLVETARRWSVDAPKERVALLRHALRSLIKAGHPGALAVFSVRADAQVDCISPAVSPARLHRGDKATFRWTLVNREKKPVKIVTDLRIHFARAAGKAPSPKVFKVAEATLAPGEHRVFEKSYATVERTTRKHYQGIHRIEALVNGTPHLLGEFRLLD
jgi:3-methyladenine DNA glycosylase AlkC